MMLVWRCIIHISGNILILKIVQIFLSDMQLECGGCLAGSKFSGEYMMELEKKVTTHTMLLKSPIY
jgi:hypothetical protein